MIAAVSIRPLPSALATFTFPATMASTRPGTPRSESPAQFERIAKAVVNAAQDHVDLLQPIHGLEKNAPVAHREIRSLDQRESEISRQIRVLEVGLVVRPGREQHDARIVTFGECDERFALRAEEWRKAQDI